MKSWLVCLPPTLILAFVLSHSWQQNLMSGHSIGWHVPHVYLKFIYISNSLSYWERGLFILFCLRDEMQSLKNIEYLELPEIFTNYLLRHVTDRWKSENLSSLVIMVHFHLLKHWRSIVIVEWQWLSCEVTMPLHTWPFQAPFLAPAISQRLKFCKLL